MTTSLHGPSLTLLGPGVEQVDALLEQIPALPQVGRRLRLEDQLHLVREIVHRRDPERDAPCAAREPIVLIGQRKPRGLAVDRRLLEKQRLAAAGRLHFAVGPFGDLQFGGDGSGDAPQFARFFQGGEESGERGVGQGCDRSDVARRPRKRGCGTYRAACSRSTHTARAGR